ncbi:MAG: dihydroorotate dehydrogenase electron transfer subunit [Lachnospiraceae bacterium]|nr:dihydroorotate dehydrogenase electron transfer subunit [Lachnospiraceae bacterium]
MIEPRHTAKVYRQEPIADGIYSMWIKTPAASVAREGQFINVYMEDGAHILPRPISICEVKEKAGLLRIVYRIAGKGTKAFSKLHAGDDIDVFGPIGNGFPEVNGKVLLFGGGIGIPPMLFAAQKYKKNATSVLGFRNETFLLSDFGLTRGHIFVATEDGSSGVKGTVIDAIADAEVEADVIFACGPLPMLRAIKSYAKEHGIPAYVSMEERMACGVGACLGCVTKTVSVDEHSHVNNARVCKDGPVFFAEEVEL